MTHGSNTERALAPFVADGLVVRPVARLASGKEATVWCCEAGAALPEHDLVAAKVYREPDRRAFSRHTHYFEGRYVAGRCARKAVQKRTRVGRQIIFDEWIDAEFEALHVLHGAGVDVPYPLARSSSAVLMEFIGDESGAAPLLHTLQFAAAVARRIVDELLDHVERMLRHDLIHGDLSAYNVLYWRGRPVIIDVPQATDARSHPRAAEFLARDIERITDWAGRQGVRVDAAAAFHRLWGRWLNARL